MAKAPGKTPYKPLPGLGPIASLVARHAEAADRLELAAIDEMLALRETRRDYRSEMDRLHDNYLALRSYAEAAAPTVPQVPANADEQPRTSTLTERLEAALRDHYRARNEPVE